MKYLIPNDPSEEQLQVMSAMPFTLAETNGLSEADKDYSKWLKKQAETTTAEPERIRGGDLSKADRQIARSISTFVDSLPEDGDLKTVKEELQNYLTMYWHLSQLTGAKNKETYQPELVNAYLQELLGQQGAEDNQIIYIGDEKERTDMTRPVGVFSKTAAKNRAADPVRLGNTTAIPSSVEYGDGRVISVTGENGTPINTKTVPHGRGLRTAISELNRLTGYRHMSRPEVKSLCTMLTNVENAAVQLEWIGVGEVNQKVRARREQLEQCWGTLQGYEKDAQQLAKDCSEKMQLPLENEQTLSREKTKLEKEQKAYWELQAKNRAEISAKIDRQNALKDEVGKKETDVRHDERTLEDKQRELEAEQAKIDDINQDIAARVKTADARLKKLKKKRSDNIAEINARIAELDPKYFTPEQETSFSARLKTMREGQKFCERPVAILKSFSDPEKPGSILDFSTTRKGLFGMSKESPLDDAVTLQKNVALTADAPQKPVFREKTMERYFPLFDAFREAYRTLHPDDEESVQANSELKTMIGEYVEEAKKYEAVKNHSGVDVKPDLRKFLCSRFETLQAGMEAEVQKLPEELVRLWDEQPKKEAAMEEEQKEIDAIEREATDDEARKLKVLNSGVKTLEAEQKNLETRLAKSRDEYKKTCEAAEAENQTLEAELNTLKEQQAKQDKLVTACGNRLDNVTTLIDRQEKLEKRRETAEKQLEGVKTGKLPAVREDRRAARLLESAENYMDHLLNDVRKSGKNSRSFDGMIEKLQNLQTVLTDYQDSKKNVTQEQVRDALEKTAEAAQKYLDKKGKEIFAWGTDLRHSRLNWATALKNWAGKAATFFNGETLAKQEDNLESELLVKAGKGPLQKPWEMKSAGVKVKPGEPQTNLQAGKTVQNGAGVQTEKTERVAGN